MDGMGVGVQFLTISSKINKNQFYLVDLLQIICANL